VDARQWLALALAALVVAAVSHVADRRRLQRSEPDRIGVIDWRTVQIAAIAVMLLAISLAAAL
jgi:hypothetical protein